MRLDPFQDREVAAGPAAADRGDERVPGHRTGLSIALALAIAGVERAATERQLPTAVLDEIVARWRTADRPAVNLDALLRTSPPATMERVLDRIAAGHGPAEGYTRAHGLTDSLIT
jgi:hypothetical protein